MKYSFTNPKENIFNMNIAQQHIKSMLDQNQVGLTPRINNKSEVKKKINVICYTNRLRRNPGIYLQCTKR